MPFLAIIADSDPLIAFVSCDAFDLLMGGGRTFGIHDIQQARDFFDTVSV